MAETNADRRGATWVEHLLAQVKQTPAHGALARPSQLSFVDRHIDLLRGARAENIRSQNRSTIVVSKWRFGRRVGMISLPEAVMLNVGVLGSATVGIVSALGPV